MSLGKPTGQRTPDANDIRSRHRSIRHRPASYLCPPSPISQPDRRARRQIPTSRGSAGFHCRRGTEHLHSVRFAPGSRMSDHNHRNETRISASNPAPLRTRPFQEELSADASYGCAYSTSTPCVAFGWRKQIIPASPGRAF